VLRRAVELGVTLIDTADSYGPDVSERLIAEALSPYPDDLVIATKGGKERTGPGQWPLNGRPDHLKRACEGSLRRLGMEQIPLYQWHQPDPTVPLEDSVGALVELKDEGKIRHLGVSNVTEDQLRQIQAITPVVSIQNRYNIGDRRSESLIDLCEQERMTFLPWAPVQDADDSVPVRTRAERYGVTPRQLVLAWLLARSPAMLVIPGTGSVAHLEDNIAAAAIELSEEDVAVLTDAVG
jgi:aryl-alcohol dehydrogenase-like predicted oxidoreductase